MTIHEAEKAVLKFGSHDNRSEGVCIMEAIAWFAGEPHGDQPECVDDVIAQFLRIVNDAISTDDLRTKALSPLIPLVAGTGPSFHAEHMTRAVYLSNAVARQVVPLALREHGFIREADTLEQLTEQDGNASHRAALKRIWEVSLADVPVFFEQKSAMAYCVQSTLQATTFADSMHEQVWISDLPVNTIVRDAVDALEAAVNAGADPQIVYEQVLPKLVMGMVDVETYEGDDWQGYLAR